MREKYYTKRYEIQSDKKKCTIEKNIWYYIIYTMYDVKRGMGFLLQIHKNIMETKQEFPKIWPLSSIIIPFLIDGLEDAFWHMWPSINDTTHLGGWKGDLPKGEVTL